MCEPCWLQTNPSNIASRDRNVHEVSLELHAQFRFESRNRREYSSFKSLSGGFRGAIQKAFLSARRYTSLYEGNYYQLN